MTRAEKALKIAKFEGWEFDTYHFHKRGKIEVWGYFDKTEKVEYYLRTILKRKHKSKLIELYSSYDGLMPIVERVNNNSDENYCIKILLFNISVFKIYADDFKFFDYNEKIPLIDALQDAIIFYHQNKESGE